MFKLKFEPCVKHAEVLDEWRAGSGFIGDYVYYDFVASTLCIIDTPCGQGIGETRDRLPRNYNTASGPDEGDHDLGDGPNDHDRQLNENNWLPSDQGDLPRAYGSCTCVCHRQRGVMHCVPCCYPEAKLDLLAVTKTFLRERGQ